MILKILWMKLFNNVRERKTISSHELEEMLRDGHDLQNVLLWDVKYSVVSFDDMFRVVVKDITRLAKYRKDTYDCDNFAVTFAGLVPYIYGVNNVGIVTGKVIREDGSFYYHAWNVFIAEKSDGTPRLYMYEPQTGKFSDYKYGRISGSTYIPYVVIWG